MPIIETSDYHPPRWLPSAHAQTIYPALFRKVIGVSYTRERLNLSDGDFLDLDFSVANAYESSITVRPLVVLSHGLEGDSTRQYVLGMVRLLNRHGFDCLAWNFRSCSGEINRAMRFYHSGATDDLETVVAHARAKGYQHINLIGFSLGNLTLKYLGEQGVKALSSIHRAVVFSVPMHLSSSSTHIDSTGSRIYSRRFNRSLKRKIAEKAALMPDRIDATNLKKIRTLRDFDDFYTSKLHGFLDAEDYYQQNSSLFYLDGIAVPTLIVNAQNDPFLSSECFPFEQMRDLANVWFEAPAKGGHCGFYPANYEGTLWSEQRALAF